MTTPPSGGLRRSTAIIPRTQQSGATVRPPFPTDPTAWRQHAPHNADRYSERARDEGWWGRDSARARARQAVGRPRGASCGAGMRPGAARPGRRAVVAAHTAADTGADRVGGAATCMPHSENRHARGRCFRQTAHSALPRTSKPNARASTVRPDHARDGALAHAVWRVAAARRGKVHPGDAVHEAVVPRAAVVAAVPAHVARARGIGLAARLRTRLIAGRGQVSDLRWPRGAIP